VKTILKVVAPAAALRTGGAVEGGQKICWDYHVPLVAPASLDSWDPTGAYRAARTAAEVRRDTMKRKLIHGLLAAHVLLVGVVPARASGASRGGAPKTAEYLLQHFGPPPSGRGRGRWLARSRSWRPPRR